MGGGIHNNKVGTLTVANSTIANNSIFGLWDKGGGVFNSGQATLRNATIALNEVHGANASGGGLYNLPTFGNTQLRNTLVADNSAPSAPDISGQVTSSFSLIGENSGATVTDNGGTLQDFSAGLDPNGLQDNGGPTKTIALGAASVAINAGDNDLAQNLTFDQRGLGFDRITDVIVDIGAFEFGS